MFAQTASLFSNPWNADEFAAGKEAGREGEKGWVSRIVQTFQAGVWPWFGTSEDAMDDLMPLGRGMLIQRPVENETGLGGGSAPEPGGAREVPFYHLPVLLNEVLEVLQPGPGKLIFDGTLGGGGHTEALLQRGARVVAMDQDDEALRHAGERLKGYADQFCALKGNFRDFPKVLGEAGVTGLDGMLIDIGVSSRHLDAAERGFSFNKDGPLDMRMDTSGPITAADIVNTYEQGALEQILWKYGEENQARKIVKAILAERAKGPIQTTLQLADLISKVCPKYSKRHPATLTFQALRIETNQELAALEDFLAAAPKWLKPGGRLAVISFHSLEDRVVKHAFHRQSQVWLDRPEWPEPKRNPDCFYRLISRKPMEATELELSLNPRARSARLRGVERLPA